jgi:hypothetical protein
MMNTEQQFDEFFRQQGFTRVSDDVGRSPNFQNADYVNKSTRVIVELKELEKEHFSDGGIIDSLRAIILKPKYPNQRGEGQYYFTIPEENREGKHDNFKNSLSRVLEKANKQLRETKSFYCNDNQFLGYVFLVHTGLLSISPKITVLVAENILERNFSSIDGLIVGTPHSIHVCPITGEISYPCYSLYKEIKCKQLADNWAEFKERGGHSRAAS